MENGWLQADGGRWLAGFRGRTGDCTVRAIALLRHDARCERDTGVQCGLCYMWAWAAVQAAFEVDEADFHMRLDGHMPNGVCTAINAHIMDHMHYAPVLVQNGKIGWVKETWEEVMNMTMDTCAFVESSEKRGANGHSTAIIHGTIQDTYDPREEVQCLRPRRVYVPLAKVDEVDARWREWRRHAGKRKASRT